MMITERSVIEEGVSFSITHVRLNILAAFIPVAIILRSATDAFCSALSTHAELQSETA